jgi:glycosyltransferase involved in cell wall biosynthesis
VIKLSIITINLNNAIGLEKTILSVINQTYNNFEYIVVDGASIDQSNEIIKKYANQLTYWISEKDSGIYNAMNKGIKIAKGEYCLFLNSGDTLISNNILNTVFPDIFDEDIVSGSVLMVKQNQKKILKNIHTSDFTFCDLFESSLNHQASFIKRSLFEKYGFYDESFRIVSDWLFTVKVLGLSGATYKFIDIVIAEMDPDGVSSNNSSFYFSENIPALEKYVPHRILKDYQQGYIQMVRQVKANKITWFLFRILNKISKIIS